MNRRDFIISTAVSGLIANLPTVSHAGERIIIKPSGKDDTHAINSALRASARIGIPATLAEGEFTIKNTIIVPAGARFICKGRLSKIIFSTDTTHEVIRIEEPHLERPVKTLFVENRSSTVPFLAIIG